MLYNYHKIHPPRVDGIKHKTTKGTVVGTRFLSYTMCFANPLVRICSICSCRCQRHVSGVISMRSNVFAVSILILLVSLYIDLSSPCRCTVMSQASKTGHSATGGWIIQLILQNFVLRNGLKGVFCRTPPVLSCIKIQG